MLGDSRTRLAAILALPSALAVSLADFTPRVDTSTLPAGCAQLYTQSVVGCQNSDFQASAGSTTSSCSTSCIVSLDTLRLLIQASCSGVTGKNVIVAFLQGQGTQQLCPNDSNTPTSTAASSSARSTAASTAPSTASSPTATQRSATSTAPAPSTSSAAPTQTSTAPATTASSASSASTESSSSSSSTEKSTRINSSETMTVSSSSVGTSIVFDSSTRSSSTMRTSRTSTASSADSSSTSVTQGGSPFSFQPGLNAAGRSVGGASGLLVSIAAAVGLPVIFWVL